ncbi:MAG: cation acetate symporter [Planctomycetes bacterium]|nr:cation acetate symporter [Planctomycetota bacterium]
MIYERSLTAVIIFGVFVLSVLGLSFYLGSKAKSAKGYFAAHGQVHWFVNGIAFAGDYLSAASFLGICGMIAFYGYDGFLYSIGYLAGWIVALFVVAEPLKRLGKFTFADALDSRFNSRGIKLAAGISALVVSLFYLIPQMVGAGALVKPLLGFPHHVGVLAVGIAVTFIVVTAGMVSTTWVQFIKGSMLVFFCTLMVIMILGRGLKTDPGSEDAPYHRFAIIPAAQVLDAPGAEVVHPSGGWAEKVKDPKTGEERERPYIRMKDKSTGRIAVWRMAGVDEHGVPMLAETQTVATMATDEGEKKFVNGIEQPKDPKKGDPDLYPVGHIRSLPNGATETGPLGPAEFFAALQGSVIVLWGNEKIVDKDASGKTIAQTTVYFQKPTKGSEILTPGGSPTFAGLRGDNWTAKIDFLSLMLALFCGTASLPHILIRYYTVKDQASARKSTVVGIAAIGFFYILTLFLGLGAMTRGTLDVTDTNMAAPLLAKSFGELLFAVISAIAFTTVLGTVSGLIMAASGAVAHDIMGNYLKIEMNDHEKVRAGKIVAVAVGIVAMVLGILFADMNVSFLVGWAFNIAASANLPALTMLLFWKGTTKQGITISIFLGMLSSLVWVLLSKEAFQYVYQFSGPEAAARALVPFSQPGIVTIPLGFAVLIVVSLLTQRTGTAAAAKLRQASGNASSGV